MRRKCWGIAKVSKFHPLASMSMCTKKIAVTVVVRQANTVFSVIPLA